MASADAYGIISFRGVGVTFGKSIRRYAASLYPSSHSVGGVPSVEQIFMS